MSGQETAAMGGRPDVCPRCGSALAPDQEWCTACGSAARTRLAPRPRWRRPVVALGALCAAALAVLAFAFADLTADDGRVANTVTVASPAPPSAAPPVTAVPTPTPTVPTVPTVPTTPTVPTVPTTPTAPDSGGGSGDI